MSGRTQRVYAYYPVDNDYAAYEAVAALVVAADPNGCPTDPATAEAADLIDFARGRPLQREVFVGSGFTDFDVIAGSVVRYYTVDLGTDEEAGPAEAAASLGAPFPNPASHRAAVPYEVPTPGAVRLAVVDVLGRKVAVLVNDVRPMGPAEAQFDASALFSGVYVVVLTTPAGRATQTLTVAR